jgi:IS5 family transposase
MSQLSFSEAEFAGKRKQTRREKFLSEMDETVPWDYLAAEIAKHYPQAGKPGRQPYPIETMLRIHFMQQWFALSDPGWKRRCTTVCRCVGLPNCRKDGCPTRRRS